MMENKAMTNINNWTSTDPFNEWFNHSKVVDKNKKPLIVYHGTTQDITVFNTEPANRGFSGLGETAIGSHFTVDRSIAEQYPYHNPDRLKKKVLEVYLSIQNPKKYTTIFALRNDLLDFCTERNLPTMPRNRLQNVYLFKLHLIKQGFDGITYLEGPPHNIKQNKKRVWVAFHSTQIKINQQ